MRAISWVALGAMWISPGALADPPPPGAPPSANLGPVAVQPPPAPPDLLPFTAEFQAAMANSQLETYRYNQLAEQALALRKLCETGFGPADICPKARDAAVAEAEPGADGLPTVTQIDGARGALRAVLVFPDGRRLTVRLGALLPGGLTVARISEDDVTVRTSAGRQALLPFGEREPAK